MVLLAKFGIGIIVEMAFVYAKTHKNPDANLIESYMPKFVIAGYIEAGQSNLLVKYNELNDKHWPFAFKCNAFNINKDIIAPFDTALNEADLIVNADAIAQDASYNKVEEIMSLTVNGTKFYNGPFSNIRSMCTDLPQNFDHVVGDLLKNQQYFTAIAFRENMQSSIRLLGFIVSDKLENTFNKKISKKVARQVAVKQTKSPTKDATCKSCGKKGHWNRRSKDCLNTTWKKKEPSAYYQVGTTVKTKLASVCPHARLLVSGIRKLIDYNSKLVYIGSMIMNFLLLHLLEQGNVIPVLDSAFVYSCLSLLAGQGSKAPENLKNALVEFKRLLEWNDDIQSRLDSTGFMQVVSYVAKQYETSLRLHIVSHYFKCSKRHLLELISNSRSPFYVNMSLRKRKAILDFIIAKKADPTSDFPSSIKQSADLRKIIDGLLQF